MSEYNAPALDDVADADEHVGDPVTPEHDVDITRFAEEPEDDTDD